MLGVVAVQLLEDALDVLIEELSQLLLLRPGKAKVDVLAGLRQ